MSRTSSEVPPAHAVANEAVTRLGVPAAGISGLILSVIAVLTDHPILLGIGLMAIAIMILVAWQTRRQRPLPVPILILASTSFAILAPFADGGLGVSTVPVLVILAFLGIFTTALRTAVRFAVWCAALIIWSIFWIYPDLSVVELIVIAAVLGGTAVSAFVVFIWADNERIEQEQSFWFLFEGLPIATWEQDYTRVVEWLDQLRLDGVDDLRAFLQSHPDQLRHGVGLIGFRRMNPSAEQMMGPSSSQKPTSQLAASAGDREIEPFVQMFVAVWEGRRQLGVDLNDLRTNGRRLDAVLHWDVPVTNDRPDYSRVIVTVSDLTPRVEAEEKLAVALASNQLLVSHEKAIATCSRALLLGAGDEGLNLALDTLRAAIGTGTAYLTRNVDDPHLGLCLQVTVASGSESSVPRREVGVIEPWADWPDELESLSNGVAYQEIVDTDDNGGRVARLGVPILAGDQWLGAFRLEDPNRTGWPDDVVNLLSVAAPMFGAHWERERNRIRLEELVQSKDQFIASVSHELRTPLSAVLGFAELLRAGNDVMGSEEFSEMLELIAVQSQDMANMVEDLLVAARADIGTITVRPVEVYLRAQVEVAIATIDADRIGSIEVLGGPGKSWADPTRTRQIVRNLLTNAIRHGGDKVVVEASTLGETTLLTVKDNGLGLPPSEWERIFEPYHHAHEQPTQPASIGLGLTVSRQLARLMGGDLTYRSDPSGSVFELRLPSSP